jgi:hypothetical protein
MKTSSSIYLMLAMAAAFPALTTAWFPVCQCSSGRELGIFDLLEGEDLERAVPAEEDLFQRRMRDEKIEIDSERKLQDESLCNNVQSTVKKCCRKKKKGDETARFGLHRGGGNRRRAVLHFDRRDTVAMA